MEVIRNRPQQSSVNANNELLTVESGAKDNNLKLSKSNVAWERKLVFRTDLTMHTAYDYKNNIEPASITALAISKDHHTLYVGDARGRVYAWSVADSSSGCQARLVTQEVNKGSSLEH
uniref:Uncharacterized protein n=4 Tax=gambiae species complex TaxID=44542 RepID=A0A0E4C7D2_ANOGA